MNSIPRFVGFSVLLLLAFLLVALAAPGWLSRQGQVARAEAISLRKTQLEAAVRAMPRPSAGVDEAYWRELGALIGATVATVGSDVDLPAPGDDPTHIVFDHRLENDGKPFVLRVTFAIPSAVRLVTVYQKTTVALLLLGGVLLWVVALLAVINRRAASGESSTRSPWQRTRVEMGSLEHLAKTSVAQSVALDREREERRRAEQDAQLKAGLLNQSLEARAGLGRDLHDGMIQSLYAVGLTLESVRGLLKENPSEADRRLEQCRKNLNDTIREVREYITGLSPDRLQRTGFTQALESLLNELSAGSSVSFDIKVDDEATSLLAPEQVTETLQIAREAVSNAIRHGGASMITLRLHKSDREICLLVQDDGTGFDTTRRREGGHGLGNMHARAKRVGAATTISSQPGEGTRVVVTLPLLQPSIS